MTAYLVLVRHGQAQTRSAALADEHRHLTEAGARAFRVTWEQALPMLPAADVAVVSSTYDRAEETAAIAAQSMGAGPVERWESLAGEDGDAFNHDLEHLLQDRSAKTPEDALLVIAAGHDPLMGELAERYSCATLPFGKGAVACIELKPGATDQEGGIARSSGRLLWFVQGAEAKRWQVLVDLEAVLLKQFSVVKRRLQEFEDDPADVETVHQLRVSIRTLRSLVAFVEPWQRRKQNRALQTGLRSVVRELSRLRELDVLAAKARKQFPPAESQAEAEPAAADPDLDIVDELAHAGANPAQTLEEWAAQPPELPEKSLLDEILTVRDEECERVLAAFGRKRFARLIDDLDQEFSNICWRACVDERGLSKRAVRDRFTQLAAAYERDAAQIDYRDAEATHDLRKNAKRLRYVADRYRDVLGGETLEGVVARMKRTQDQLGDLCDARANGILLEEFAQRTLGKDAFRQACVLIAQQDQAERQILNALVGSQETPSPQA